MMRGKQARVWSGGVSDWVGEALIISRLVSARANTPPVTAATIEWMMCSVGLQTEFTGAAQRSVLASAVRVFYLGILRRLARRLGPGCLSG